MKPITKRQQTILEFIRSFIEHNGYSPSIREIGDEFDIRSPNGVARHLKFLRKYGYVTWKDGASRTLRVLK